MPLNKERNEHMKKQPNQYNNPIVLQDAVTNSGIMLNAKGEMYIIKDGKKMRLNAFNYLDKNLDHNELIIFIGRLESYYDRYITHLKAENEKLNKRCGK